MKKNEKGVEICKIYFYSLLFRPCYFCFVCFLVCCFNFCFKMKSDVFISWGICTVFLIVCLFVAYQVMSSCPVCHHRINISMFFGSKHPVFHNLCSISQKMTCRGTTAVQVSSFISGCYNQTTCQCLLPGAPRQVIRTRPCLKEGGGDGPDSPDGYRLFLSLSSAGVSFLLRMEFWSSCLCCFLCCLAQTTPRTFSLIDFGFVWWKKVMLFCKFVILYTCCTARLMAESSLWT